MYWTWSEGGELCAYLYTSWFWAGLCRFITATSTHGFMPTRRTMCWGTGAGYSTVGNTASWSWLSTCTHHTDFEATLKHLYIKPSHNTFNTQDNFHLPMCYVFDQNFCRQFLPICVIYDILQPAILVPMMGLRQKKWLFINWHGKWKNSYNISNPVPKKKKNWS